MKSEEAMCITLSAKEYELRQLNNKQKELIEQYYSIAEEFIKEASLKGSFNTMVCHTYDDYFDRKGNEVYSNALEIVAMRLRDNGFNAHYYNNRHISTMSVAIDWKQK